MIYKAETLFKEETLDSCKKTDKIAALFEPQIHKYLAVIEQGWVEFCRSRRVLSTDVEGQGG